MQCNFYGMATQFIINHNITVVFSLKNILRTFSLAISTESNNNYYKIIIFFFMITNIYKFNNRTMNMIQLSDTIIYMYKHTEAAYYNNLISLRYCIAYYNYYKKNQNCEFKHHIIAIQFYLHINYHGYDSNAIYKDYFNIRPSSNLVRSA